jgi:hypothetical protein
MDEKEKINKIVNEHIYEDNENKIYTIYKSKEEAEYESKMATQIALVQLGKILNEKENIEQNKKDLFFLLNDLYEYYEINGTNLQELYKIPVLLTDKYFEKNINENEHFAIIKSKEQKLVFYKMLLFVYILKEELESKNKEIELLNESNNELNETLETHINEIEDYEKEIENLKNEIINEKNGNPYKEELEVIKKEYQDVVYNNVFLTEIVKILFSLYVIIICFIFYF